MNEQTGSHFNMTLTYNDVTLVPRVISRVLSRGCPDTTKKFSRKDTFLKFPVIASPMDTVCGADMAIAMESLGGLGIIHRFQSIEDQKKEVSKFMLAISRKYVDIYNGLQYEIESPDRINVGFAIPAFSFQERLDTIMCTIGQFGFVKQLKIWICVDTANGLHDLIARAVNYIETKYDFLRDNIVIVVGNVASREGYRYLTHLGVDVVRVGISNGAACSTGIVTGVGQGIASTIIECVDAKNEFLKGGVEYPPFILADGGIQNSGDVAKAIAMGADLVMMGSMLAGFKESCGTLYKKPRWFVKFLDDWISIKATGKPMLDWLLLSQNPKNWWKPYRGMASHTANKISNNINSTNKRIVAEGVEHKVPYIGSIYDGLPLIQGGMCSAMSYFDSLDMDTFTHNTKIANSIVQQTYFSHIERSPFVKNNGL
jgi:IMP dehydrogenase